MEERNSDRKNSDTQTFTSDERSCTYADGSVEKFHFLPKSENSKTMQCSLCDFNQAKSSQLSEKKSKNLFTFTWLYDHGLIVIYLVRLILIPSS